MLDTIGIDERFRRSVDDHFNRNAAQDLNATGSDASGETIQRDSNVDMNDLTDWTQTGQSWGVMNAGQTML